MRNTRLLPCLALGALALASAPAPAQSKGDWTLGVGIHQVDPKSDNGKLAAGTLPVEVEADLKPTLTAEYFIADNLGLELLASWPFEHDIRIAGLGKVGSARQLPPTVSLQYHFNRGGKVAPFLGAGVNYTTFFSEDTTGALAGSRLRLDDSWGLAAHAGVDFSLGERDALRIDARWIDLDSEVRLDGQKLGTVHVDPVVYGVAYVHRF